MKAPTQKALFTAFEEEGWPRRTDVRWRLGETLKASTG
jgi:hypothetical protein